MKKNKNRFRNFYESKPQLVKLTRITDNKTEEKMENIHGATLNGTVNPKGSETSIKFEYGLTAEYDHQTDVQYGFIGNEPISVSAPITGLAPLTEFHFRIWAENIAGISVGEDMMFTTLADIPVAPIVKTLAATDIS